MIAIRIHTPEIALGSFLKWAGVARTGGEAKLLIHAGAVSVNGRPETRRGRKLHPGDVVCVHGRGEFLVTT